MHADLLFLVTALYLPGNVSFEDGNLLDSYEIKSGFLYVCIILLISLIAIIIAFTLFFTLTVLELSYINPIHPASSPWARMSSYERRQGQREGRGQVKGVASSRSMLTLSPGVAQICSTNLGRTFLGMMMSWRLIHEHQIKKQPTREKIPSTLWNSQTCSPNQVPHVASVHPAQFIFFFLSCQPKPTDASRSHLCKHWHQLWQEVEAVPVRTSQPPTIPSPNAACAQRMQRGSTRVQQDGRSDAVWTGAHQKLCKNTSAETFPLSCRLPGLRAAASLHPCGSAGRTGQSYGRQAGDPGVFENGTISSKTAADLLRCAQRGGN